MSWLLPWCVLVSAAVVLPAGTAASVVAEPPFGAAQRIDDAHAVVQPGNTAVAVDADGNAVAVWQSRGTVFGSRRPAGGDWSAPTAVVATEVSGPDVVALRDDGTAYLDVGTSAPDGDALVEWYADGSVAGTGVSGQDARARVLTDLDGDLVAYTETANGSTTYHFPASGSDPAADGWTSTTPLRAFGSSRVAFGNGHGYYVAYPPDATGAGKRFRVRLVDGLTGGSTLVLRHRLCADASGRLAGYDVGAA